MKRLRPIYTVSFLGIITLVFSLLIYQGRDKYPIDIKERELIALLEKNGTAELKQMLEAGEEIRRIETQLSKRGSNIVKEVLKGEASFLQMAHYPRHDVFDPATFSQYYYHAHRNGEHGHFHLFLRQGGMDDNKPPLLRFDGNELDSFAHIIAISMSDEGEAISLFTTNQWVTGEDWYTAESVKGMVSRFSITLPKYSFLQNRWLNLILTLFRPQIMGLIEKRDEVVISHLPTRALEETLKDQNLDVLGEKEVSVELQMEIIRDILQNREASSSQT